MILTQKLRPGANCPEARLEVVDARKLTIYSAGVLLLRDGVVYTNNVAIAAEGSTFSFALQDKLKMTYMVTRISQTSPNSVTLVSELRNRTTVFLVPALLQDKSKLGYDTFLVNAYCLRGKDHIEGHIHLKYRYFPIEDYRIMEHGLLTLPNFVSRSEYGEYTIITLAIPSAFIADIEVLIQGKYSLLGDMLKKQILSFHKANVRSDLHGVLYKDASYRMKLSENLGFPISTNAELFDIPIRAEESLML